MKGQRWAAIWMSGLCLALPLMGWCAWAAPAYPTRQVELIAPTAPGGASDLVGRAVAGFLSKKWGQPMIVTAKPGGSGAIGVQAVLSARADGYTMFVNNMTSSSMLVAGMKNPPFKLEDQVFVARIATCPVGYAVKSDAPWKTLKEFAEWAKANPEKLNWATSGATGLPSFGVYQFLDAIGVDARKTGMVITGGGSESVVQLAGGHVVLACQSVQEEYALTNAGNIRILAHTGEQRLSWLPDVPTCMEAGFPELNRVWWAGISGHKKLPKEVIQTWEEGMAQIVKDPQFLVMMEKLRYVPGYLSSTAFSKFVYDEMNLCTNIAEKTGIRK
jgi:tripartite-type tricarboxylate transporter receptor subunit TctC